MALIAHLSDLHLVSGAPEEDDIVRSLTKALRAGSGDEVSLTISPAGPRSLLRIFWPLE